MAEDSRFAEELRATLKEKSISAEEVVTELNKCGFPLPLHTFSYWLQGYFLPRSESAFQLVSTLEKICGCPDNRFADALLYDLCSGKAFVPGEQLASAVVDLASQGRPARVAGHLDEYFDNVEEKTDWDADMIRRVIKDEIRLSADYKTAIHKVTNIALIPQAPNPAMKVSWLYEKGDKPLNGEYVIDVQGAHISQQTVEENDGVVVFSMSLALDDADIIPGRLHTISYTWGNTYENPRDRIGGRIFPWELDFYSCTVIFEGVPPASVEYAVLSPYEDEAGEPLSVTPLVITNRMVKMSAENFGEVSGYIRYTR